VRIEIFCKMICLSIQRWFDGLLGGNWDCMTQVGSIYFCNCISSGSKGNPLGAICPICQAFAFTSFLERYILRTDIFYNGSQCLLGVCKLQVIHTGN